MHGKISKIINSRTVKYSFCIFVFNVCIFLCYVRYVVKDVGPSPEKKNCCLAAATHSKARRTLYDKIGPKVLSPAGS